MRRWNEMHPLRLDRRWAALVMILAASTQLSCSKALSSEGNRVERRRAAGGPVLVAAGPAPGGQVAAPPQALAGTHHAVFSMLDNRVLAHLVRDGGLFIPLGYPGAAKYVNFNRPWSTWKLSVKEDGRSVALSTRNITWLRFPLTEAQAKASTLTFSVKSPGTQGLTAKLNNTRLKSAKLTAGWQKIELEVPRGALWSGENKLELSWGGAGKLGGQKTWGGLEWLHLGTRALADPGPLTPAKAHKLILPAGGGLAYFVHPYRGAKLRLRYPAARCDVRARLTPAGARATEVVRSDGGKAPGQEVESVFDLAPIVEKVARLELTAEGSGCKQVELAEASIVMPGPEPKVKRGKAPKTIIFWMMDNARSDRYALYNPSTRVKTPVITELGNTGTVFTRAYIQGNESRVSHASIWTSLYPRQHNFIAPTAKLALSWVTMPEALQKAGYYTAAWLANGFVSKRWGFGEGWKIFKNYIHDKADVAKPSPLSAEGLAGFAMRFLEKPAKDKLFIYVGTIDSHVSWRGRQPWLKLYHPEPYKGTFEKDVLGPIWEKVATGSRPTPPADRKRVLAIYDSTVSYNDSALGKLLATLKEKGLRDDTMIVITADHGEELWDHGHAGHGSSIKQELVAVPLVIHYPPLFGKGVKVRQGVDVLSLMPTILDAVGQTAPDTAQGESLLPLAQGVGAGYPRPSIASQYELAHAIRLERWKLRIGGKAEPELWDLEGKTGEREEIGVKHPHEVRWLTDALSTFLVYQDRWRSSRWGVASNLTAAAAEDLETGGGPGPIKPPR